MVAYCSCYHGDGLGSYWIQTCTWYGLYQQDAESTCVIISFNAILVPCSMNCKVNLLSLGGRYPFSHALIRYHTISYASRGSWTCCYNHDNILLIYLCVFLSYRAIEHSVLTSWIVWVLGIAWRNLLECQYFLSSVIVVDIPQSTLSKEYFPFSNYSRQIYWYLIIIY